MYVSSVSLIVFLNTFSEAGARAKASAGGTGRQERETNTNKRRPKREGRQT